ncbi:MAG: DUF4476 domain-containing protein [Bacteroidetes bacterium]|nr:DUF4476 domain-containing protein [Bacteroidota bacterium]
MKRNTILLSALMMASVVMNAQNDVNVNMNVNDGMGGGVNMNVNMTGTQTQQTTTTTTTTSSSSSSEMEGNGNAGSKTNTVVSQPVEDAGCTAISSTDFTEAKGSIESKTFADTKMTVAKQIIDNNCFSADQVKQLMGLFTYEEQKLEIAKYCYSKTTDKKNYYKVNDAFTFEASIDDLTAYLKTQK